MKSFRVLGILVALCISLAMLPTSAFSSEKGSKWNVQILWSAGGVEYRAFEDFCKRVGVLTNGRLQFTPQPAGAIVPTFETLDAVRANVLQAMVQWPGYFTGKDPAFAVISDFICAYDQPWEYEAWFYYGGGQELITELYKPFGVVSVGVAMWGIESEFTTYPFRKPEDFAGKKWRSPHGMTADLVARMGGSPVILPGEETYSALDKGVIDALDWATPSMNHGLGFSRVAKYFTWPGFRSMPISTLAINAKEWEKLPKDIQEIVKSAMREYNADVLARLAIEDIKAVEEMKAMGLTQITWADDDIARLRTIAREIWLDWGKKSALSQKVVDSQLAWLRKLGKIK